MPPPPENLSPRTVGKLPLSGSWGIPAWRNSFGGRPARPSPCLPALAHPEPTRKMHLLPLAGGAGHVSRRLFAFPPCERRHSHSWLFSVPCAWGCSVLIFLNSSTFTELRSFQKKGSLTGTTCWPGFFGFFVYTLPRIFT